MFPIHLLGVNKYIKEFDVPGFEGSYNSGINVNASYGGKTLLVIYSEHTNGGDATDSGILMIRCGYDGNNYSIKEIAKEYGDTSGYPINITIDTDGYLIFSDQYSTHHVLGVPFKTNTGSSTGFDGDMNDLKLSCCGYLSDSIPPQNAPSGIGSAAFCVIGNGYPIQIVVNATNIAFRRYLYGTWG